MLAAAFLVDLAISLVSSGLSAGSPSWPSALGVLFIAVVAGLASSALLLACVFSFAGRVIYRASLEKSVIVLRVESYIGAFLIRRKTVKFDGSRMLVDIEPLCPGGAPDLVRLKSRGQIHWLGLYHTTAQRWQLAAWIASLQRLATGVGDSSSDTVRA
jgi:hypothetical protein